MLKFLIFSALVAASCAYQSESAWAEDGDAEALESASAGVEETPGADTVDVRFSTNRSGFAASPPTVSWPDKDLSSDASYFEAGLSLVYGLAEVRYPRFRVRGEGPTMEFFGQAKPSAGYYIKRFKYFPSIIKNEAARRADTEGQFISSVNSTNRSRLPLIYIHGFNTTVSTAIVDGARLALDTRNKKVIVFDWPGDLNETKQQQLFDEFALYRFVSLPYHLTVMYYHALAQEYKSFSQLKTMITLLRRSSEKGINIVAHSLGCHLLYDSMTKDIYHIPNPLIANVILAAPDVSKEDFLNTHALWNNEIRKTKIFCNKDRALLGSFLLNGANERLGDCDEYPTNIPGIVTQYESGVTGFYKHGYFIEKMDILDAIESLN